MQSINCIDLIDNYLTVMGSNISDKKELAIKKLAIPFFKDETAVTTVECVLIAAGISVAVIVIAQGLGTQLNSTFTSGSSALK